MKASHIKHKDSCKVQIKLHYPAFKDKKKLNVCVHMTASVHKGHEAEDRGDCE